MNYMPPKALSILRNGIDKSDESAACSAAPRKYEQASGATAAIATALEYEHFSAANARF